MPNERLRDALIRSGHSYESLGDAIGVDPKSIQRWVIHDRVPHGRNRHAAAILLAKSDAWLWPTARDSLQRPEVAQSEVIEIYPHRADSPIELWAQLFGEVRRQLDVLVYAGLFLAEQEPKFVRRLAESVVGIFSNPLHVAAYPDGEVRQQFSICLRAEAVGGAIATSDEASDVSWVSREPLEELGIHPETRRRIDCGRTGGPHPHVD